MIGLLTCDKKINQKKSDFYFRKLILINRLMISIEPIKNNSGI